MKDPSSRLLRWRLKLEEFDYEVVYKPGVRNTKTDALSRITTTRISPVAENSSELTKEERKILQEFHEQPTGGHLGMKRTFERIKLYASWPGMKQENVDYIKHCDICQKNKITQRKTKLPLQITDTPEVVWKNCSMDIVGPLTQNFDGNKYLPTFQYELSKYNMAVPIPQQDASTIAGFFVEQIILKFGIPQVLLTVKVLTFLANYSLTCANC